MAFKPPSPPPPLNGLAISGGFFFCGFPKRLNVKRCIIFGNFHKIDYHTGTGTGTRNFHYCYFYTFSYIIHTFFFIYKKNFHI